MTFHASSFAFSPKFQVDNTIALPGWPPEGAAIEISLRKGRLTAEAVRAAELAMNCLRV